MLVLLCMPNYLSSGKFGSGNFNGKFGIVFQEASAEGETNRLWEFLFTENIRGILFLCQENHTHH